MGIRSNLFGLVDRREIECHKAVGDFVATRCATNQFLVGENFKGGVDTAGTGQVILPDEFGPVYGFNLAFLGYRSQQFCLIVGQ